LFDKLIRKKREIARHSGDKDYAKKGGLYHRDETGKLVINREAALNTMIKLIIAAPLHRLVKEVLVLRLAGDGPDSMAMTHIQVALRLGLTVDEVKVLEKDGQHQMSAFLNTHTVQDAIEIFNRSDKHKNEVNKIVEPPQVPT
jgi:hypothetical protein